MTAVEAERPILATCGLHPGSDGKLAWLDQVRSGRERRRDQNSTPVGP